MLKHVLYHMAPALTVLSSWELLCGADQVGFSWAHCIKSVGLGRLTARRRSTSQNINNNNNSKTAKHQLTLRIRLKSSLSTRKKWQLSSRRTMEAARGASFTRASFPKSSPSCRVHTTPCGRHSMTGADGSHGPATHRGHSMATDIHYAIMPHA